MYIFSRLFFKLVTGPYPASHYSVKVKHPTTQWRQSYQLPGGRTVLSVLNSCITCSTLGSLMWFFADAHRNDVIMSNKTKQWLPSVVTSIYSLPSGSPLFLRAAVHPSEHRWQIKLRFKIVLLMHLPQPWVFFKYFLKLVYQAGESGQY